MHSSILVAVSFAVAAMAAPAVSEFTDGQPQATTIMPATTTAPYTNGFTTFLTETNSEGVVTGMPSVVTSMPAVVTSMPAVVTSVPGIIVTPGASASSAIVIGSNTTVTTSKPKTTATTVVSTTPSGTSAAAAGATTSPASGSGSMVKPVISLGLVGALFAVLL